MSKNKYLKDKGIDELYKSLKNNRDSISKLQDDTYDILDELSSKVYKKIFEDKMLSKIKWYITPVYGASVPEIYGRIYEVEWKPLVELLQKCDKISWAGHSNLQLTDDICLAINDNSVTLAVRRVNPKNNKVVAKKGHDSDETINAKLVAFMKENNIKVDVENQLIVAKEKAEKSLEAIKKVIASINDINNHSA